MDARTYLKTFGTDGAQALVEAVNRAGHDCKLGYFKQIAYGYRRPSYELAEGLVLHDPQRKLDLASLMGARKRKPDADGAHAS